MPSFLNSSMEAPAADPHAVFVECPVHHVRHQRHAGRRRQQLPRHRLADVPDLVIDDGPEHDARACPAASAAGGRRSPNSRRGLWGSSDWAWSPLVRRRCHAVAATRNPTSRSSVAVSLRNAPTARGAPPRRAPARSRQQSVPARFRCAARPGRWRCCGRQASFSSPRSTLRRSPARGLRTARQAASATDWSSARAQWPASAARRRRADCPCCGGDRPGAGTA